MPRDAKKIIRAFRLLGPIVEEIEVMESLNVKRTPKKKSKSKKSDEVEG